MSDQIVTCTTASTAVVTGACTGTAASSCVTPLAAVWGARYRPRVTWVVNSFSQGRKQYQGEISYLI